MKFQRYASIIPPSKIKLNEELNCETTWIIQEKIHGANFSMMCDGNEVIPCKRSGKIENPFKFFRSDLVLMDLSHQMFDIFENVAGLFSGEVSVKFIQLFGELFGGRYPHEKVFNHLQKSVQPEVFYHPSIKFIAFDCLVAFENNTFHYISPSSLEKTLRITDIPSAIGYTLIGTLKQAIEHSKYSFEDPTKISRVYGLPDIENNIREGNIIRPFYSNILVDGSPFIVKHKNSKFKETHLESIRTSLEDLSEEGSAAYLKLLQGITVHRIDSMIGKVGEDSKRYKEICGRLLKEIEEEVESEMSELKKEEQRFIRRTLMPQLETDVVTRFLERSKMNKDENV